MRHKSTTIWKVLFCLAVASLTILSACESGKTTTTKPAPTRVQQFIREAVVIDMDTIEVTFRLGLAKELQDPAQWKIEPGLTVVSVQNKLSWGQPTGTYTVKLAQKMKMGVNYKVVVGTLESFIDPNKLMDALYSNKQLGMTEEGNNLVFRVFVPRAMKVMLCLFQKANPETPYKEVEMTKDENAVWEITLPKAGMYGQLYGYRIFGPETKGGHFNSKLVVADPYSKATAQNNVFPQKSRTVILPPDITTRFPWRSRKWTNLKYRDAMIYEVHVRDMTMHPTSLVPNNLKGTYLGFINKLAHIKGTVGCNAIELLPVHEVGNVEPPYQQSAMMPNEQWIKNTWNPYSWNHWGYMTSNFFAVDSMYATGYSKKAGDWNGLDGRQLKEFKQLVDACHAQGIAVILDVVYNHVSQYDENSLKVIDYNYYFRSVAKSGCGNDFMTERPMARKLIIDSLKYFVQECNVDGFRFDLAGLIDHETGVQIKKEVEKIHPGVLLIAEPWVGRYCPTEYSEMGWASWNDRYRNDVKGGDGNASGYGGSFIYGKASGSSLKLGVAGTLKKNGGLFMKMDHAINYLASHDNNSLGDHIRIDSGRIKPHEEIPGKNVDDMAKLTDRELKINKLGALILYTSQGGLMILAGQEWAQAKVVHPPVPMVEQWAANKAKPWTLDHDSYEKDNETNWLNYKHLKMNIDLANYYFGLSQLRMQYDAFRWSEEANITWLDCADNNNAQGWLYTKGGKFVVLANGSSSKDATFTLPAGNWKVLADDKTASPYPQRATKSGTVVVPATTGMVLMQ